MKILAIETSCDETSLALVEASGGLRAPRFRVIKNFVSSQIPVHRPFGGVVPTLAKREHIRNLPRLYKTLVASGYPLKPDLIAVTVGPGLEMALWTGIAFAKRLAKKYKAPLIGANHLEGHLYSFLLEQKTVNPKSKMQNPKVFPAVALIVSGGHTILLYMKSLTSWKKLGETRDDAAGEAFDKVARMLRLPYPGGPEIERLAFRHAQGKRSETIPFPRPMLAQKNYDFSFAGLKTAVLYFLRDHPAARKADVAASFQDAIVDTLVGKTIRAAKEFRAQSVILCGGVAANQALRKVLQETCDKERILFRAPVPEFNADNAAMIAAAAYINRLCRKKYRLSAQANLNL